MSDSNIVTFSPNETHIDVNYVGSRFTVKRAVLPGIKASDVFFVLENGIPHRLICEYILVKQERNFASHANEAYVIAKFMNTLLGTSRNIEDITIADIRKYFIEQRRYGIGIRTIHNNIDYINNLFSFFQTNNQQIHESLINFRSSIVVLSGRKEDKNLTIISYLKDLFVSSTSERGKFSFVGYTKWYTPEQVDALYTELRTKSLAYAAIFLDTVLLGHRVDSALSILLKDTDLRIKRIIPSRSKTNKTHASSLPNDLSEVIRNYILTERNVIVEKTNSTSPYLYLNKHGKPVSYSAYYKALKAAANRANQKNPDLNITDVRTHAGRATFAAGLRSKQLEDRRAGKPTFSDADIRTEMDWRSIETLDYYDIATRAQETAKFTEEVQNEIMRSYNRRNSKQ